MFMTSSNGRRTRFQDPAWTSRSERIAFHMKTNYPIQMQMKRKLHKFESILRLMLEVVIVPLLSVYAFELKFAADTFNLVRNI